MIICELFVESLEDASTIAKTLVDMDYAEDVSLTECVRFTQIDDTEYLHNSTMLDGYILRFHTHYTGDYVEAYVASIYTGKFIFKATASSDFYCVNTYLGDKCHKVFIQSVTCL